ncbi:Uncharacterised protein [Actinobacillus equuli]|nr:Uncharacterised protein [Actinobacillus equuli]
MLKKLIRIWIEFSGNGKAQKLFFIAFCYEKATQLGGFITEMRSLISGAVVLKEFPHPALW